MTQLLSSHRPILVRFHLFWLPILSESGSANFCCSRLPLHLTKVSLADGSPNTDAFTALNLIRNRASLLPFENTDGEAFKKAVWDQLYFELCYENKVWFHMLRTLQIRDDETGEYVNFIGYTNNWGKIYSQTQLLLPLPLSEMQRNFNLIQNPGY